MSSREDKDLFLFGWFLIIVFAITMIVLAIAVNNYSAQDDSKKPVALETNSIGCTKYRYIDVWIPIIISNSWRMRVF